MVPLTAPGASNVMKPGGAAMANTLTPSMNNTKLRMDRTISPPCGNFKGIREVRFNSIYPIGEIRGAGRSKIRDNFQVTDSIEFRASCEIPEQWKDVLASCAEG
jgi:hypothetical protein